MTTVIIVLSIHSILFLLLYRWFRGTRALSIYTKALVDDLLSIHISEREEASGIVIDPGGTCLCRRCGHTVSAVHDHCENCNLNLNWDA